MAKKLFGSSVGWLGTLRSTFEGLDLKCAQTTLGGEASFKIESITSDDFDGNVDYPRRLVVHASHMVNLASPKNQSRGLLQATLKKLSAVQEFDEKMKLGVVAHIGRGTDASIERVIEQVLSLQIPDGVTLYLENSAGQGHELGSNLDELEELFDVLPDKIKLCLDTQHSFASGLCQWQTNDQVIDFFEELDSRLPNRLRLIHLNDSKTKFGSRVDRHANLGAGHIWGGNGEGLRSREAKDGLLTVLEVCVENKIPLILETPDSLGDLERLFAFWDEYKT